jgi:hypothetical protein
MGLLSLADSTLTTRSFERRIYHIFFSFLLIHFEGTKGSPGLHPHLMGYGWVGGASLWVSNNLLMSYFL